LIPLIIPPLTALTVLVTRPAAQAAMLCDRIGKLGGAAIAFPVVDIEAIATAAISTRYDLTIFTSSNAVQHGITCLDRGNLGQVAAIGPATRAALAASDLAVQIFPEGAANSEALLAHPEIKSLASARVLIVRGRGGREMLRETLVAQGCAVEVLEVYERVPARPSAAAVAALEQHWSNEGIDVVTVTSGEILEHLYALLTDAGRSLLNQTPLLVVSERVRDIGRRLGLHSEYLIAAAADDATLTGTLANWQARARISQN
jgi:uroporphyrinogen-III synthase